MRLLPLLLLPLVVAELYPYGPQWGDKVLPSEGWHATVIDIPIIYLEKAESELFISGNGIVGLGDRLDDEIRQLQDIQKNAIATFYTAMTGGRTHFRASSSDRNLLKRISIDVRSQFPDNKDFTATQAVVVTWERMKNKEGVDGNTFQLALVSDGSTSYAVMSYKHLVWAASEGKLAQAGFSHEDGRHQPNVNSGTESILDLINLSNTDTQGQFMFRISGPALEDPSQGDDDYAYYEQEQDYDGTPRDQVGCPPDPYRDNCPAGCSVIEDDRQCRLCICAEKDHNKPPPVHLPETNDLEEEEPPTSKEELDADGERDEDLPAYNPTDPRHHSGRVHQMPIEDRTGAQVADRHPVADTVQVADRHPVADTVHHEAVNRPEQPEPAHREPHHEQRPHERPITNEVDIPYNRPDHGQHSTTCAAGSNCHSNADCEDHHPGYCCVCREEYYGNGRECLKKGDPQRISGGFEGVINGQRIERTDLHTYITGNEGSAFTAVSKVPTALGPSMMLLAPIGSIMGWLFAEVANPSVYNGFQLTGGLFNRTASVHIGDTSVVTIRQDFSGRDIYHYFKANVFVTGTLPEISESAQVQIAPYDEEYRREGPGLVRSYSNMEVTIIENGTRRKTRMTVDQQIHYAECQFKEFDKQDLVVLNVKQVHVTYDPMDGIVRYQSRNWANTERSPPPQDPRQQQQQQQRPQHPHQHHGHGHGHQQQHQAQPQQPQQRPREETQRTNPLTEQGGDVCSSGRHQCTLPNMKCRPYEHSYRCECQPGYQAQHDTESPIGWKCVDVNECDRGDHTCDQYAVCTNTEGGFNCVCNEGFTGNGHTCMSIVEERGNHLPQNDQEDQHRHREHHVHHANGHHGHPERMAPPVSAPAKGQCTQHTHCHQWGECVFTPGNPTGSCKCRGWYVGDGVDHCGPPEPEQQQQHQRPQQATHQQEHQQQHEQPMHEDDEVRQRHNANIPVHRGQPCGNNICDRNAECMPSRDGGSECVCRAGFHGNGLQCESLLEEERQERPRDGGVIGTICRAHDECSEHGSCAYNPSVGYYQCKCSEPYVGDGVTCEAPGQAEVQIPYNQAEPAPGCDRLRNCHSNAQCVYDSFNRKYVCECIEGHHGDGYNCVKVGGDTPRWEGHKAPTHECSEQTDCHHNAHCVESEDSRTYCECLPGFKGDGKNECRVADQCTPADPQSCNQNAECVYGEHEGGYVCKCIQGFTGDGSQCRPHAAPMTCDRNPRLCHHNAQCVYNHEREEYGCLCKPGTQGDGYSRCDQVDTPRCSNCSVHASCVSAPNGAWRCQCSNGYVGNGHVCAPLTSCLDDRSSCDKHAECVPGEGGHYVCNCRYGYHGNGRSCAPDSEHRTDTLLVARGMAIFQRGTHQDIPGKQLVVIPHHIAVGVDFDCQEERIVWSDISGHAIRSSSLMGTNMTSHFSKDLQSPEGIAVDWSSRNVYYADSLKDEIGVVSMDGKYQKALVTEGLVNPRALAIDLYQRHLYYTDWHREHPIIGRVDLDGKNNEVFLQDDIHLPNGLTILPNRRELCWVDAGVHRLSCIGLDGRNRRDVYHNLNYPFGVTHVKEERFYWTDWKDNRIHSVGVYGDAYASMPISLGGSGKVYGIVGVPDKCQGPTSSCSLDNGGCAYLCLPGQEGVHCECPDNVEGLQGC